jgi:hypothetical protein
LASSSTLVAAAAGAATTTAAAHVILGQERGDRGREHGGPLLGSRGGPRAQARHQVRDRRAADELRRVSFFWEKARAEVGIELGRAGVGARGVHA